MVLPSNGKLVRDRIPEIIRANGETPVVCRLSADDRPAALRLKLLEEAQELAEAPSSQVAEEIADVVELLFAIADETGIAWDAVLDLAQSKRIERGGFTEGLWLLATD
jgi:predicted house-cleaning noncanonical NTP pyrophosphatase (MazG superfamily)